MVQVAVLGLTLAHPDLPETFTGRDDDLAFAHADHDALAHVLEFPSPAADMGKSEIGGQAYMTDQPYDERLLRALQDGRWHRPDEFPAPPVFRSLALEAWVRVLRHEGHGIERRGAAARAAYRLQRASQPPSTTSVAPVT